MHAFDDSFREELERLIKWRRDVRRFLADPVDEALLAKLLELANYAPSVGMSQPWRFVPVEAASTRARIVASFEACNAQALGDYENETANRYAKLKLEGLREAPVQLGVFCDEATDKGRGLGRRTMPEMLRYSVVTAVHTFWIAARAAGLGVGWVSILDPDEVRDAIGVPEEWVLVAYLCVGWPKDVSETPELEEAGWERRKKMAALLGSD